MFNFQRDGDGTVAASAPSTDNSAGAEASGEQLQATANADQAGDEKDKGKQPLKVTFTADQQAAVDLIVKERLEREHKKSELNAEKVRKQAEEESLAKNKEFETLAEQRKAKVTELETQLAEMTTFKEQAEKYKGAMETLLKAQVEKLPNAIKVLIDKLDPIEKLEYLAAHAKELNIEVIGVPESDTSNSTNKLNEEAMSKAKQSNTKLVKGFFGG